MADCDIISEGKLPPSMQNSDLSAGGEKPATKVFDRLSNPINYTGVQKHARKEPLARRKRPAATWRGHKPKSGNARSHSQPPAGADLSEDEKGHHEENLKREQDLRRTNSDQYDHIDQKRTPRLHSRKEQGDLRRATSPYRDLKRAATVNDLLVETRPYSRAATTNATDAPTPPAPPHGATGAAALALSAAPPPPQRVTLTRQEGPAAADAAHGAENGVFSRLTSPSGFTGTARRQTAHQTHEEAPPVKDAASVSASPTSTAEASEVFSRLASPSGFTGRARRHGRACRQDGSSYIAFNVDAV